MPAKPIPPTLDKHPYLRESILYGIWKYANAHRVISRSLGRFEDLAAPDQSTLGSCILLLGIQLSNLGVEIEELHFHKKYFLEYNPEGEKEISSYKDKGVGIALQAVFDNKFTFKQFQDASLLYEKLHMSEWFEFSTKLTPKTQQRLDDFLNAYLDAFITNDLAVEKVNYFSFSKHKYIAFDVFKSKNSKFGKTFVLRGAPQGGAAFPHLVDVSFWEQEFIFIHCLLSLERAGYIKIEDIWVSDTDVDPEKDDVHLYKARITLLDKYFEETKPSPPPVFTSKPKPEEKGIEFDPKTSILKINGRKTIISKSLNSRQHYLLTILMKDPKKLWDLDKFWKKLMGSDDYDPDLHWKELHNSVYPLNTKIAAKTGAQDFIYLTKTSLQISKKYLV